MVDRDILQRKILFTTSLEERRNKFITDKYGFTKS
jgi:hypothetical protein